MHAIAQATDADNKSVIASGPIRLGANPARNAGAIDESAMNRVGGTEDGALEVRQRSTTPPSEFEAYASELAGVQIQRLGSALMLPSRGSAIEANRQVPSDYLVGLGDEIQLTIWGSVDADLRLTVDRSGRIVVPRIGPVVVAGVRHADLNDLLTHRVAQVFKNFQLSATLGRLRSIRYYVTGFVARPGAYSVSSLATVMTGLVQAGGPAAAGSFRNIELRRNGQKVGQFDLYDLLVRGDKKGDLPLQADDVLHVGPIGPQVALIGSVNRPAVVELKGSETVSDAIAYVGGLSTVADMRRVAIERLSERNDRRVVELTLPQDGAQRLNNGDVVRAFNSVTAALPQAKQYKRVRVEGEVARPGDYVLPPTSTLVDAIQTAGGLTPQAYLFGTDLSRESVRKVQEVQYDRALRDLETDFTRNTSTQKVSNAEDAAAALQKQAGTTRLIERLRAVRPSGRVVLDLTDASRDMPALPVEDGDRLYVPARANTVGVFGSVFNGGSYLLKPGNSIDDIVRLAGGPTRGADAASMFVLRANGSVVSARQSASGWLGSTNGLSTLAALPGDTVFVPEELNKTTFVQEAKEWTQILYQFGLGAAALKTIRN
ncbi:protein involved in polysaccharide export with SLBB domain [Pelomonas aquatica]|uniref:Protein involved in polysaccharide export with SLBB domain n=1 Tax=Pelomonas aquatica TaxID=431058 RepID=A0ABU1Z5B1_9BURK|nr:SLBB domain-containing protein [Pelomonas aquatica]MDR7295803.1 protein involved in polysaccharide export with SLBB domain [Pelomonas aquatica]